MPENDSIIPNTFQCPNFYVDRLWTYLTSVEAKVLTFAIREILGWRDRIVSRKANISLSVFTDGKRDYHGNVLCNGCGLSKQAVVTALNSLHEFNILVKGGYNQKGQLYYLQVDADRINWQALYQRRDKRHQNGIARTDKARTMVPPKQKGCQSHRQQVVSPTDNSGQSHRQKVVSPTDTKKPIETQNRKEELKSIWAAALVNLKNTMAESTYNAHLLDTKPISMDNGRLVIRAQGYSLDWLRLRLGDQINQAVSAAAGREVVVEYQDQEEGS